MNQNSSHKIPFVAIVGKPNVGKSSLFNRLAGKRVAIVSAESGTTRDRVFQRIELSGIPFVLVDTGGIESGHKQNLEADMQTQAHLAIAEADLILFLVDGRSEPTAEDLETANILRRKSKKIILVANKIDSEQNAHNLLTWTELGFGEAYSISVIHNHGIGKLTSALASHLLDEGWDASSALTTTSSSLKIAFIGRPNAGKSSLVNALLGENRVIVSEQPGTTRDSIDIDFTVGDQQFTIIDTAGLRRRGKIEQGIEKWSSFRTINAIERSDIVCLVLDYTVGIRAQDLHICSYILEAHKGLILLINKSDLMEAKEEEKNRIGNLLKRRFSFLSWAPVLFVSAKNRQNIDLITETASEISLERQRQIEHQDLVDFIQETSHRHQPPTVGRQRIYFYDLVQIPSATPTFEYLVNHRDLIHFSYRRFLENEFRQRFGFNGTAIRFFFKSLDKKQSQKLQPL
jgi:GTP-binding protein